MYSPQIIQEARGNMKAKSYKDSFLFQMSGIGNEITNFILSAHRVDKTNASFEDIRYEVSHQQVTSTLMTMLNKNNIILLIGERPLPRSLKVFLAADPKDPNRAGKIFIDVTEIIIYENNAYSMNRKFGIILVSYLLSAMNILIYHVQPDRMVGNATVMKYSTEAFAKLFAYIIDYLRIGGVDLVRQKCLYMAAWYWSVSVIGYQRDSESTLVRAKKISGLDDQNIKRIEYSIDHMRDNMFDNISTFVKTLQVLLKTEKLTLDAVVNKWMFLLGTGTQYGLELYESFASICIYAFTGSYLNNQNTIDKIAGPEMIEFVKAIMKVGSDSI